MAHKKGLGSSRNGRDSNAQRLGVKDVRRADCDRRRDHRAPAGNPLQARRGRGIGKDDTLYARAAGTVQFTIGRRGRMVNILPAGDEA